MKIYAISGLGADKRVFDSLNLDFPLIHLDWITQLKNESIESYSKRLSEKIDASEEFVLLAVSFGGLIATEINKFLKPKLTILISSVETKEEIPSLYKFIAQTKLVNLLPKFLLSSSNIVLTYLFGTKKKKLLKEIIADSDVHFSKWAVLQLINWKNTTRIKKVLKISGSKDKLLPAAKDAIILKGGEHFMEVDRAVEISAIINEALKKMT